MAARWASWVLKILRRAEAVVLRRYHGLVRCKWYDIDGWFNWRSAQEEAVTHFPEGSRFVEVGTYLGRSLCSLGEVVERSGKRITLIGVDTCRGSGPEGWRGPSPS